MQKVYLGKTKKRLVAKESQAPKISIFLFEFQPGPDFGTRIMGGVVAGKTS